MVRIKFTLAEIERILLADTSAKPALIHAFQQMVWNNSDESIDTRIAEVLRELAYDLDFYEPNIIFRAEDPSFYGEAELDLLLRTALDECKLALRSSQS